MQLVGLFMNLAENDPHMEHRKDAFKKGLKGFVEGKNVQLKYFYGAGDFPNYRQKAKELITLDPQPNVIFSGCGPSWRALEDEMAAANRDISIVFAGMIDPTPTGRLATKGTHVRTGFISYRADLCPEWLDLLKRMKPQLTRVAVLQDPGKSLGGADPGRDLGRTQLEAIQNAAPEFGVTVSAIDITIKSEDEIERAVAAFASKPNGGLIVPGATLAATRRQFIIDKLAVKHSLPAIYPNRMYTESGGLMSFGAKTLDLYESAAELVAKLLTDPDAQLPGPTHREDFELVINLQAAAKIGHTVPKDLLNDADCVIQ